MRLQELAEDFIDDHLKTKKERKEYVFLSVKQNRVHAIHVVLQPEMKIE